MVRYSHLAVATLASLKSPTSAFIPEGSVDRTGSLFKNVRTVLGSVHVNGLRSLQDTTLLTTRCFTYCIEQSLTPEDCAAYIEEQIQLAGGHEVGPVEIKIQVPRPVDVLSDTYWMVEVPVNLDGQMTCDRNSGQTYYPFEWVLQGGAGVPVPPVDCQGKSSGECCLAIRALGQTLGKDENGSCLSCFPHQEPLIPVPGAGGGPTEYQDYIWNGSTCQPLTMTIPEADDGDVATRSKIVNAQRALQSVLDSPSPDCGNFSRLLQDLYDASVVVPALPQHIGRLACGYCYDDDNLVVDPDFEALAAIIMEIMSNPPEFDSTSNTIIIYTDADGNIVDIPKLGGSRADDPYDDDCTETPSGSGGSSGGTGPEGTGGTDTGTGSGGDTGTGSGGDTGTGGTGSGGDTGTGGTGSGGDTGTGGTGSGGDTGTGGTGSGGDTGTGGTGSGGDTGTGGTGSGGDTGTGSGGDTGTGSGSGGGQSGVVDATCYTAPSSLQGGLGEFTGLASCDYIQLSWFKSSAEVGSYGIDLASHEYDADSDTTTFTYNVCTAEKPECDGTTKGRRLGKPTFNARAAISHVSVGIDGTCAIKSYKMYDADGVSVGNDFTGQIVNGVPSGYAIGKDPTTCVSGFKFDLGWDIVKASAVCTEPASWCRLLEIEIAGEVPLKSNGLASIKASTGFTIYDVETPDCTACARF